MRYCLHCGHIHDEFDVNRDDMNCWICSAILQEDDMTALKFAQLSETEKDEYERQLIEKMRNELSFSEEKFQNYSSMKNGEFWMGFRFDKYSQYATPEDIEYWGKYRKENEPFKPFPPIDKEKARACTYSTPVEQKKESSNVPKCPTCQSTAVEKISLTSKVVGGALFGLFSSNVRKTMHCKNCGYRW